MLEESKREKLILKQRLTKIKQNLELSHTRTVRLIKEMVATKKQLEQKKQEIEVHKRSHLKESQQLQSVIRQREEEITKLKEKLSAVKGELERKEQEIEFLKKLHLKADEQLQSIIKEREEEIKQLKQQLSAVESQLSSERKHTQDLREQLGQTNTELIAKSTQAQEFQKSNSELKNSLDIERKRVNLLLMQMVAASSQQHHTTELEVCILYVDSLMLLSSQCLHAMQHRIGFPPFYFSSMAAIVYIHFGIGECILNNMKAKSFFISAPADYTEAGVY